MLKVADFGFAKEIITEDLTSTLCGSPLYLVRHIIMLSLVISNLCRRQSFFRERVRKGQAHMMLSKWICGPSASFIMK